MHPDKAGWLRISNKGRNSIHKGRKKRLRPPRGGGWIVQRRLHGLHCITCKACKACK